jgi:tetratricopeptide (TPR) repeat protein
MHRHIIRLVGIIGVVWLTAAGGGCAKFNLFYNAETAFSEAEEIGKDIDPRNQPTSAQKTKYKRCITKCELVIDEYPNSAYIDDALFHIGKSRFRMREWSEALVQFDNLLANFPNSPFLEETMYLKSLSHISRGDEDTGLEWFARLRESYPTGKFGVEALYRLGDAYALKERYEDAARYYQEFLDIHPDHESSSRVLASLGRAYYDSQNYEEAARVLIDIDREKMSRSEFFEAEWLRLSSLNRLARPDEAAEGLPRLEEAAQSQAERARMLLLSGRVQLAQGNEDEGLFTLESTAKQFEGEPVSFEALSAIVEYLLRVEGPTGKRFRSQLESSIRGRMQGKGADRLRRRQRQLERFDRYMAAYEKADSTSSKQAFRLAESMLIDFRRPENALDFYQEVIDRAAEGPLAPRAAYAIAFIYQNELSDSTAAALAFSRLAEAYPESPQARSLAGESFLEAKAPTVMAAGPTPDDPGEEGVAERGGRTVGQSRVRARFFENWPLRRGGPGAWQGRDRIR